MNGYIHHELLPLGEDPTPYRPANHGLRFHWRSLKAARSSRSRPRA